jgi:glycosyltransferase involved in cell wall biosynthesis
MKKILGLALYGPLAASHRYRIGQYVPGLAVMGIGLDINYLLGDDYLSARFSEGPLPIKSMLMRGLERIEALWNQNEYDCVLLQCELMPLMPGWLEHSLIRKPYIYDFDDAFYLKYRRGKMSWAGQFLGDKFDKVIRGASAVTAGNYVLADYAHRLNAKTYYLPTVVDTNRYVLNKSTCENEIFTIGWIGSPSTVAYLTNIIEPLSDLGRECSVKLVVVGGEAPKIPNVTVISYDWNEHTELDLINSFDVGVMPLTDDEWARGKCAFKLIQYMACGVPVIASPVGANVDVVNAECGLLASSSLEWLNAFRRLRNEPNTRKKMGIAGRNRIEKQYSLTHNLPILSSVISKVLESR